MRTTIYNALLRIDEISGEPSAPFEKSRQDLNFWVLELPDQEWPTPNLSMAEWCTRITQIIGDQTEHLRQAQLAGGKVSLFVAWSPVLAGLQLETAFLRVLTDFGISLECSATDS